MSQGAVTQPAAAGAVATRRRGLAIALYTVGIFLYWVSLYLYVPTLPMYVQARAGDLAVVGVILSMYGLWQGIIRFPLGIVADWLGRRQPFIIGGLILSASGALLMGRATSASGLLVGRSITGLAAGAWVPMVAAFSGLFAPGEAVRASAIVTLISSLGRILGTSTTGLLNGLGGYSLAFVLAAAVAGLSVVVLLPTREARRPSARLSPGSIGRLITRRDVLLPAVLSAVMQYANWAATFGFLPILASQLGMSDVMQSLLTSLNLGLLTVGNLAVATFANRINNRLLLYFSFAMVFLGLVLAALASAPVYLLLSQISLGLGQGVGYPVMMGMSIRYVADGERTTAMGLYQAVYSIGMFAGPGLSGLLAARMGIQPMFGMTAVICLAAGWLGTRHLIVEHRT